MRASSEPSVVISINCVELESPIVHAKFQDHQTTGTKDEILRFDVTMATTMLP